MRRFAIGGIILVAIWWAWPASGPTYHSDVARETEVYPCRRGAEPLPVTFSNEGRVAEVRFRGRTHRLPFVGKGVIEDIYAADGWQLTLDPEANWYGPGGLHLICAA